MKHRAIASGILALSLSAFCAAGEFAGEILANSDIVGLTQAQVAEDIIVAKIRSTPNVFELSTRDLVTLKGSGVSDAVIRAMQAAMTGRPAAGAQGGEARFRAELENAAREGEAAGAGAAWMIANREQALPLLRRSLSEPRPELRSAAVIGLSRLGDRDSLPAIRNMLTDSSPAVRQAVAQALVALDDASAVAAAEQAVSRQQLNPLDGYIRVVGYARLTQASGSLGRVLEANADSLNRVAAAWALGEIGRAGVAGRPALETALASDSDAAVRREAAAAVAKFRDAQSARQLQDACARDPEVRKATLAAMADYPETVEFLVGVLNLGPEQIAADELETARASLARLTGRDFGMDGPRWTEWYAANRASFPSAAPAPAAANTLSALPPASFPPASAAPRPSEVDVEAWSIVADSSGIPMAPQVDGGPSAPGGFPAAPPLGFTPGGGRSASGTGEFSAATPSLGGAGPLVPTDIPDMLSEDSGSASSAPPSMFRTWSSDPRRAPRSDREEARSAAGPEPAFTAAAPEPEPAPSAMPSSPVVARTTDPIFTGTGDGDAPGGISLPLPPMDSGAGSGWSSSDAGQAVADPYSATTPEAAFTPGLPPMGDDIFQAPDPYAGSGVASDSTGAGAWPDGGAATTWSEPQWVEVTPQSLQPSPTPSVEPSQAFTPVDDELFGSGVPVAEQWGEPDWSTPDFGGASAPASPAAETEYPYPMPTIGGGDATEAASETPDLFAAPQFETPAAPIAPPTGSLRPPSAPGDTIAMPPVADDTHVPGEPAATEKGSSILVFVEPEPGQMVVGDILLEPGPSAAPEPYAATSAPVVPESAFSEPVFETPGTSETSVPPPADPAPAPVVSTPPPPAPAVAPAQAPAFAPDPSFSDPGTSLPPVRAEGTVTAPRGKDLPPLLGEGMFGK